MSGNADGCYLNIPFKEVAKLLRHAMRNVEGVDLQILDKIGEQTFDDFKAIERRINDPDCGGGCCSAIFSGSGGSFSSIASTASANVSVSNTNSGNIAPTGYTTSLAAGAWVVSGEARIEPDAAATGYVYVFNTPGTTTTQGGNVSGTTFVNGQTSDFTVPFSGLLVYDSAWTTQITVSNQTDVAVTPVSVTLSAARFCDPCDYTVNQGGL